MTAFKYLFCLVWVAMLVWLLTAYGWAAAIIAWFGCMFFGAFVLVEKGEEDD